MFAFLILYVTIPGIVQTAKRGHFTENDEQ
jgi:hypothetical protein